MASIVALLVTLLFWTSIYPYFVEYCFLKVSAKRLMIWRICFKIVSIFPSKLRCSNMLSDPAWRVYELLCTCSEHGTKLKSKKTKCRCSWNWILQISYFVDFLISGRPKRLHHFYFGIIFGVWCVNFIFQNCFDVYMYLIVHNYCIIVLYMWGITFVCRFVCGGKKTFAKSYILTCGSSCALAMIVAVWIDLLILMPITSGIAASLPFTGQPGELVDVLSGWIILRECRFMIADLFFQLADSKWFEW